MERARLTGSNAPQQALAELERLALRGARVGSGDALAGLGRDPLAAFTAPALDDSVLAAALARLDAVAGEELAAAPRARSPRRLRRRGGADGPTAVVTRVGSEAAPAALRPAVAREHARRAETLSGELLAATASARPADSSAPLAAVAAHVPGGLAAIATSVARATREAAPAERTIEIVALEAILARFSPAAASEAESAARRPSRPRSAEPSTPLAVPVAEPGTSPAPFGRRSVPAPETADAAADVLELTALYPTLRSEAFEPVELPRRGSSQGLAELVRRWESARPDARDDARRARDRLDAGPAPEADEAALARAVERLLTGELRRSGIEVELG